MPNLFRPLLFGTNSMLSHRQAKQFKGNAINASEMLPRTLTRAASQQTYYTIKFLVDRDRVLDAFRAYAYFRWIDDQLDQHISEAADRMAFIERQEQIIDGTYCGERLEYLSLEESMLKDLIQSHPEPDSGLAAYIRYMIAVMAFDTGRRGRLISQQELSDYSCNLAIAVTEAMHYFIGYKTPSPQSESRYLAVTAAHITHMLRDTYEDVAAGYFNIPREFLEANQLDPYDVSSNGYREWVKTRVQLARTYFEAGKKYLAQVRTLRCRMAGYAYTARFESVLNAIERDQYQLRPVYPERKNLKGQLRISWFVLSMLINELTRGA